MADQTISNILGVRFGLMKAPKQGLSRPVFDYLQHNHGVAEEDDEGTDLLEATGPPSQWIILPGSRFSRVWTVVVLGLLIYTVVFLPVRIAFGEPFGSPHALLAFDITVDTLFMLDTFFSFFTAYRLPNNTLVTGQKKIALHYLKTWFVLDFLASFPFYLIKSNGSSTGAWSMFAKTPRLLRLIRLLRLARLFKAHAFYQVYERLQYNPRLHSHPFRALKLLGLVMAYAHLIACAWFYIGDPESPHSWLTPWVSTIDTAWQAYVLSYYWTVTTLVTDGYGDVTPGNTGERIFAVFVMISGCAFFAYSTGSLASMIQSRDERKQEFRRKMASIMLFLDKTNQPRNIRRAVIDKIEADWQEQKNMTRAFYDWAEVVEDPALRKLVVEQAYSELLAQSPFFKALASYPRFVTAFIAELEPITLPAGTKLAARKASVRVWQVMVSGTVHGVRKASTVNDYLARWQHTASNNSGGEEVIEDDNDHNGGEGEGGGEEISPRGGKSVRDDYDNGNDNDNDNDSNNLPGDSSSAKLALPTHLQSDVELAGVGEGVEKEDKDRTKKLQDLIARKKARVIIPSSRIEIGVPLQVRIEFAAGEQAEEGDWLSLILVKPAVGPPVYTAVATKPLAEFGTSDYSKNGVFWETSRLQNGAKYLCSYHRGSQRSPLAVSRTVLAEDNRPSGPHHTFQAGDSFGEAGLLTLGYQPCYLLCATKVRLFSISMEKFLDVFERFERDPTCAGLSEAIYRFATLQLRALQASGVVNADATVLPRQTVAELRLRLAKLANEDISEAVGAGQDASVPATLPAAPPRKSSANVGGTYDGDLVKEVRELQALVTAMAAQLAQTQLLQQTILEKLKVGP